MRRILFLFCCLLLCGAGHAQKTFRYAGYVQMPSDPLVSYYLELTIAGNTVHGYSITGYKDGNRLKAAVQGYFTTPSDLHIRETASLDGRDLTSTTYCYFSAHLKLTIMMNGQKRWNGPFESRQSNGVPCIGNGGVMTVTDNAPPLDPVPKPNITRVEVPKPPVVHRVPKDTPKSSPPKVIAPKPPVQLPKPVLPPEVVKKTDTAKPVVVIKPQAPAPAPALPDSCQRTYEWSSPDFSFDIWDGYTIDGDVVSLRMNGKSLLEHKKLDESKQHFTVPLDRGLNVLYIYLHEEGFEPPNTPNLTLYDGSKTYELAISGNVGEIAKICIWRK